MATRTFNGNTIIVNSNLDENLLEGSNDIIVRVRDEITNTYVNSKTIPISNVIESENSIELESTDVDDSNNIKFENTENGIVPTDVTYNVYFVTEPFSGDIQRTLVSQIKIIPEIVNGEFKYYFVRSDNDISTGTEISFGDKEQNIRYNVGDSLFITVTNTLTSDEFNKAISITYEDVLGKRTFDKNLVVNSIQDSISDNLSISGSSVDNSISITNSTLTESERFLKFGVITNEGDNLIVTNWVDGGLLNQVETEIEPLGSLVLELYNPASPLDIKDTVLFTELYSDDIILDVDFGVDELEEGLIKLSPNFQKEVEENTISTFNEYQSFDELTLSGSSIQERIIDYFLQEKKDAVGLNTDFTDFTNFVKFSSAEERLVNFKYKVQQLEDLTNKSASLATSSASPAFVTNSLESINDQKRTIKNGFDEYEQFLFNDSGSIYENKPFVSSSDGVYASWPKNTPSEQISGFTTASVEYSSSVSQSLSLTVDTEYVLKFDVQENGLPISIDYNGKTILEERTLPSGSNEYEFSTRNLQNTNDLLTIRGADYGNVNLFTEISNLSVKEKPTLLASDSSEVVSWFNEFREIAKDYDARNKDSLKNNTPSYIINDSQNDDYILFLNMIGQMFDEIWLYGNELGNLYDWNNDISKGLSEDLSIVLLEAYGNNLDIGFSEKDVWEYVLGLDDEENELARQVGFSFEKRQKETIRRLLVNLPYFLKHKGTARSIKGLILSYGIPLSTMFIKEYGTFQGTDGLETIFSREKETKKLNMSGSKNISLSDSELNTSNAIELNFELLEPTGSDVTLVSGSSPDGFDVSVKSEASGSGSILLTIDGNEIVSSSAGPLYNGEFWNVLTQQTDIGTYEVKAYQFNRDDGTFEYKLSGSAETNLSGSVDSIYTSGSEIKVQSFNGYLDEFRVWDTTLSDSVFTEHVKFPTSIKLSDPLQIPDKLLLRVDIETNTAKYIASGSDRLPNLVFNPQYATQVTVSGFTVSDFETYTRTDYINSTNVGNEKLGNNKVRYQVTQSLNGGVLTPNSDFNVLKETNESVSNIDDSYKLTIGFSPTDITNEIILQHFGGNDLLDEFGDPTNVYNDNYADLKQTVENFFENISTNRKTKFYIEYIRNFDKTLFENIKKFVPERADLATSIFIEPHFLDRSKAKRLGESETEDLYNEANDVEDTYEVSSTSDTNTNDDNQLIVTSEETLISEVLSESNTDDAVAVISEDEVFQYLNQSTDVIVLQDGFESQVLQNNVWEEDSSILVKNKYGEAFRFKVYKFDYSDELASLEAEIGAYIENNDLKYIDQETGATKIQPDKGYEDLIREWENYYELNGTLFLLDYGATPIDNAVLVTYEDLPYWLREELILSEGTKSVDKIVNKSGITYELSDDTADGGSVVETTTVRDTKTIVSDPDGDVKLTVE